MFRQRNEEAVFRLLNHVTKATRIVIVSPNGQFNLNSIYPHFGKALSRDCSKVL